MRGNPFDESLSPKARRRLQQVRALRELPEGTDELCSYLHRNRVKIRAGWEREREDQHFRALDQALEREEVQADVESKPSPEEQAQKEAEDDRVFAHIQDRDYLLEFRNPQLYLRGHRALERREARRQEELQQPKVSPPSEPEEAPALNGTRVWAIVSGIFAGLILLYTFSQSIVAGVFAAPFLFFGWLCLFRLPLTYIGTFSGGGARSGGNSGNYV